MVGMNEKDIKVSSIHGDLKMKKIISVLLLLSIAVFALSACGMGKSKIEDYEWKMRTIAHVEGEQLVYDAAAEESTAHPEAKIIEMTLVAKDGKITITDITKNKTYEGTYTVSGRTPEGTDYNITIDGKSGYATVAMTTYADGTEEPTLPISLDGYTDFIFLNREGGTFHQGTMNKTIRRIIRDCNDEVLMKDEENPVLLPHFSCHSLRHTFTTRMCEAGVNIKVMQDTLGHADISTTLNIYADVTKELKKGEFADLDAYFKGEVKKTEAAY